MKKYLLLFLLVAGVTLTSCSSDDDGDMPNETDPIVGTWVLTGVNPPLINVEACPEESVIRFQEDNTVDATFYLESEDCEAMASEGTWQNTGNSIYILEVDALGDVLDGAQEGTVTFHSNNSFTYSTLGGLLQLSFERS